MIEIFIRYSRKTSYGDGICILGNGFHDGSFVRKMVSEQGGKLMKLLKNRGS